MVGRLFGSPSQDVIVPASLNSPKSQSRKERIEQARQDKSRRRNFGFLKTGASERGIVSSNTLSKRREHAKQLANLAYSEDPAAVSSTSSLTPTSRYAHQQLLSSLDAESPQGSAQAPPDPFSTAAIDGFSMSKKRNNFGTTSSTSLFLDSQRRLGPDREPTASTVDTFDTSSVGSAFDMEFVTAASTAVARQSSPVIPTNAVFAAGNGTASSGAASRRRNRINGSNNNTNNVSLDHYFVESTERNKISMPTIPSNSSMQASNLFPREMSTAATGSLPSTTSNTQQQRNHQISNGGGGGNNNNSSSSVGAAARRRMRSHMRNQSGSNSSVGSASSNQYHHHHNSVNSDANSVDASFTSSVQSTPPESPSSMRYTHGGGSASKNRVEKFQQQQRGHHHVASNISLCSTGGGSVASSSAASTNIFDSDKVNGGFTFDAFGLDQSEVEREVNAAMQELAGQGIAGFSIFVDKTAAPAVGGTGLRREGFIVQSDDEFTPQVWDTSPFSSRNASPVQSVMAQDAEDFIDGFRIKQPAAPVPVHGYGHSYGTNNNNRNKSSALFANRSANSSSALTEESNRQFSRSTSRGAATDIKYSSNSKNSNSMGNHLTPPRWEASSRVLTASTSPHMVSSEAFQSPVVTNPWKEDPWASDDGGNGSGSDFGGDDEALSDVHDYRGSYGSGGVGSFGIRGGRMSYSGAKSDIGVSSAAAAAAALRPAFYQLPPEERPKQIEDDDLTDHSDDMSQMQEELATQFAEEFVRRSISPKASRERGGSSNLRRENPTNRVLNFGDDDEGCEGVADGGASRLNLQTQTSAAYLSRYSVGGGRQSQSSRELIMQSAPNNSFKDSTMKSGQRPWQSRLQSSQTEALSNRPEAGERLQQAKSGYKSREIATPSISAPYHRREQSKPDARNPLSTLADGGQEQSAKSQQSLHSGFKSHLSSGGSNDVSEGTSRQKQHQLSSDDIRVEEKKDDDDTSLQLPPAKVGSLKARWEAKTRVQTDVTPSTVQPKQIPKLTNYSRVQTLDSTLEMLSPEIVEARRVAKQQSRTEQLRKSLGVDTNPQGMSAKSDIQGSRYDSSVATSILDRVLKNSSLETSTPGAAGDTKSDGGSTPSFLANVKLRNVSSPAALAQIDSKAGRETASPSSSALPVNYSEEGVMTQNEEPSHTNNHAPNEIDDVEKPAGRKLTYRERREIELQREKDEKAKSESAATDHAKTDVASLIRKRIAANKQKNLTVPKESSSNEFQRPPIQLKPSEKENNFQVESRPNQMTNFLPPSQTRSPLQNDASSSLASQFVASRLHPRYGSPNSSILDSSTTPPTREVQPSNLRASSRFGTGTSQSSSIDNLEVGRHEMEVSNIAPGTNSTAAYKDFDSSQDSSSKSSPLKSPPSLLEETILSKSEPSKEGTKGFERTIKPDVCQKIDVPDVVSSDDVKSMLSSFLGNRAPPALPLPTRDDDTEALKKHHIKSPSNSNSPTAKDINQDPPPPPPPSYKASGIRPALKDDPKFERYFRMLKMGLPLEVAKHAMVRDGLDPSVLDLDHDKPIGIPLKEDPKFEKYFKMMKIGIAMNQVKHAMERDGLNPDIMDQDHSLPVMTIEKRTEQKVKETHRRARLHWKTIGTIVRNSLWAKVETEVNEIDIDEEEFNELFKADLKDSNNVNKAVNINKKKGAAVRVVDAKRANNGGIILARLKMTHDEMADAVDRIDSDALSAEQIENIIEYLPSKEEREALEEYMLEGGQDAAEKFDGLCECEKFMVSMMTVKHAKRKIRALLFKLQFLSCMESIAEDARTIDNACDELIHSNRLRQLFGIILQFGNRLNTAGVSNKGKAGAFTLDSLLKLSQAKAFDKKTTFLHYIILIVQRNNEILLNYYDDLPTVLKGDKVFWDQCLQDLEEVENQLENVRRISLYEAKMKKNYSLQRASKSDEDTLSEMELTLEEEVESLRATPTGLFTLGAIKQVSALRDKIERTKAKFELVLEYFGEDTKKLQPHELFRIISAFTRDFQKAKEEVFSTVQKKLREERKKARIQTPNEKKGLPTARPHSSAINSSTILRASDHQPTISKILSEGKPRSSATLLPNVKEEASSPSNEGRQFSKTSGFASNNVAMDSFKDERSLRPSESEVTNNTSIDSAPSYRNMQYPSEIPEEKISNEAFADEGQRYSEPQKVLYHRQFPPMRNGTDESAQGRAMNIALAPQIRPTNHPMNSSLATPSTGAAVPSSIRSPREALRNRRRLEAMRTRYATSNSNSNPGGGDSGDAR